LRRVISIAPNERRSEQEQEPMRVSASFEDHLRQVLEEGAYPDIRSRFAEDCLLVTSFGTFHGHDGVLRAAELLDEYLPNARYDYEDRIHQGELCFLGWSAEADGASVSDGADSFLIQDGTIRVMTIYYTATPPM
jgi:hypothetical protein